MSAIGRAAAVFAMLVALQALGAELPIIPDATLTPGVVRSGLTVDTICATKWGTDARHFTAAMKRQVFQSYGATGNDDPACVPDDHGARCEIDHLISRELGGADDVKNLWPQPYGSKPWNAHLKDRVENRLHVEVCASRLSIKDARRLITSDWREAYKRYFGEPASDQ
jgi:hypothetical protein